MNNDNRTNYNKVIEWSLSHNKTKKKVLDCLTDETR